MPEPKHTPLPWKIKQYDNYTGFSIWSEADELYGCIAERWEPEIDNFTRATVRETNAAFIVLACNSHYELVKVLESALHSLGGWREIVASLDDMAKSEVMGKAMWICLDQMDCWKKHARAALAAAGVKAE